MSQSTEEKLQKTAERLGIRAEYMPRHIAIIMDGNGRWAQQRLLPRAEGHRQGGKTVEKIAQCCVNLGIESLTLYSFSIENWKRPRAEIEALMHLYTQYLIGIRPTLMKNNTRLVHVGRTAELPGQLQTELAKTIEQTASNTGMILALALNYGGRTEIVDAVINIAEQYKDGKIGIDDIDESCIRNNLYVPNLPDPDLLIRTASEMRISNFLLWQISYSEFYVSETYWPDFRKDDMEKAILSYAGRNRRFGDIGS